MLKGLLFFIQIPKIVAVKMLIAAGYRYHGLQGKIPKIWTPNLS